MLRLTANALFLVSTAVLASASPVSTPINSVIMREAKTLGMMNGKAVYITTNNKQRNAVAAFAISPDGTLSGEASLTTTGGCGSIAVNAKGEEAVPDALVGQSALTIAGNNIFAVNAGSNTVSMFKISPYNPLSLHMVGQPAAIPGTFPNTVAASVKNSLVCVGTTGSKAGISCANFDGHKGIGNMDKLRPFNLSQSDPPMGPTNTVSQTFFSVDETMLYTTIKGNPAVNNTGFLSVFPVSSSSGKACGSPASLSQQETRSSPAGTAVLFGSDAIPSTDNNTNTTSNKIFVTDASFGAGILSLDPSSMKATLSANQTIAGQRATCWSTISPLTNTAFVTDVGVNRIIEMSLEDASIVSTIDLSMETASARDPGLIDLKAAGGFVYALSPGNGSSEASISVVDVKSKKLVQHAMLGAVGVKATAQGMALLL